MKKILIVDDQPISRSGLIVNIKRRVQDVEIVECTGETGLLHLACDNYDLIITDGKSAGIYSFDLIQMILLHYPGSNILIFTDCDEKIYRSSSLSTSAFGYLSKSASIETIQTSVENILKCNKPIADSLHNQIEYEHMNSGNIKKKRLSEREFEIAFLLLKGQSITYIAKSKNLKVSTISTHKTRIFSKLGIENLLQLKDALYLPTNNKTFSDNGNNLEDRNEKMISLLLAVVFNQRTTLFSDGLKKSNTRN